MAHDDAPSVVSLHDVVHALDAELRTAEIPDYPGAWNGLQVANSGTVSRVAVAVDASLAAVTEATVLGADLLIVHHGLFWGGVQPVVGVPYKKMHMLLSNNIAVYSTHLPLDAHPTMGNNVRLAESIGLSPSRGFGRFKTLDVGVAGECDEAASAIVGAHRQRRLRDMVVWCAQRSPPMDVARADGRSSPVAGRRVSRCATAREQGIDTLIVGEGPHHTTVDAQEQDLLVIHAGHYATETLGVQALGAWLTARFGVPSSFLSLPTGS